MSDEEWALVAPYLILMTEDAPQRESPLRQVFNGLRWLVGAGAHWRMMPHDLPPWPVISQQTQCWLTAGVQVEVAKTSTRRSEHHDYPGCYYHTYQNVLMPNSIPVRS